MSSSDSWHGWYCTARWRALRSIQLKQHPLCTMCAQQAHVTVATVVDHIRPHKGDPRLFWNSTNLQSLCKNHHDGSKQKQEHVGYVIGCDAQGNPIDPRHHWRNE